MVVEILTLPAEVYIGRYYNKLANLVPLVYAIVGQGTVAISRHKVPLGPFKFMYLVSKASSVGCCGEIFREAQGQEDKVRAGFGCMTFSWSLSYGRMRGGRLMTRLTSG